LVFKLQSKMSGILFWDTVYIRDSSYWLLTLQSSTLNVCPNSCSFRFSMIIFLSAWCFIWCLRSFLTLFFNWLFWVWDKPLSVIICATGRLIMTTKLRPAPYSVVCLLAKLFKPICSFSKAGKSHVPLKISLASTRL